MIIGLTGGIGSGKTATSDAFKSLGIDIIDADMSSRRVVERGQPALEDIQDHFGSDILDSENNLDRAKLREIIFKDPKERVWLEELLHPKIAQHIKDQLESSKSPYCVLVSPLLLETEQKSFCSSVLVVDVPEESQISRTSKRDGVSEEQVKSIIATQINREQRLKQADEIIINDGSIEELKEKILVLHTKYLSQC
jgi:dephospho-CoA kinase|tara:strand:- start:3300 stop:3887 length:588 start_codon:yes stop_codon:yes gene_type:complete